MGDDYKYVVVEEEMAGEYGKLKSYGIAVEDGRKKLDEVNDISIDREKVKKLAETFNELELSLVHFRDVLEDLLP